MSIIPDFDRMTWNDRRQTRVSPLLRVACAVAVFLIAAHLSVLTVHPVHGVVSDSGSAVTDGSPEATQEFCSGPCHAAGGISLVSIFPISSDRKPVELSDPEIIELTDEQAGELFDVLASGTAREILQRLSEEPHTATDLAEVVDTSLQNVHYHLKNLDEAGAITELDVEYSARGREMSVYTASAIPQILVYDTS